MPAFKRLVSHPSTELNLFDEIERGRVIIVDTNAGELEDGTSVIGRFFLAMLGAVSRRRIKVDERRKTPCFVYIDELADYCNGSANQLGEILATCRKQNIAICAANQRLSQIPDPAVRDALKATDIKFANPLREDANTIAVNMGETPASALTNRPSGSFAAHIRGMRRAVSIRIPYPNLSALETMTEGEYGQVRQDIRARYAREPEKSAPEPPAADPPAKPPPRAEKPAKRPPPEPEDYDAPQEFVG